MFVVETVGDEENTLQPFFSADFVSAFTNMAGSIVPSSGEYIAA